MPTMQAAGSCCREGSYTTYHQEIVIQLGDEKMRSTTDLEGIAEKAMMGMPSNITPSELGMVISIMAKGHAIALKNRGM